MEIKKLSVDETHAEDSAITVFHRPKAILVAGWAGFVGSHLFDRLLDAGHTVICLDNLQTGQEMTIFGEGQQTGSFCCVDDLVEGLIRLMASDTKVPVNPGNPGAFTRWELADKALVMTGSASRLVKRPLPVDDPRQRKPDITCAKAIVDWEPQVMLEQGLKRTIRYFADEIAPAGQKAEAHV